jgi:hypothetical protein
LAAGFSRVCWVAAVENCLNSFPPGAGAFTRLKPSAKEALNKATFADFGIGRGLQSPASLRLVRLCDNLNRKFSNQIIG